MRFLPVIQLERGATTPTRPRYRRRPPGRFGGASAIKIMRLRHGLGATLCGGYTVCTSVRKGALDDRNWPKAAPIWPPRMGPLTGEHRPRMREPGGGRRGRG